MRQVASMLVLALGVSCGRPQEQRINVSDVFRGVEPLSTLDGVRLPLTVEELLRARPGANPHAYFGMSERIGSGEIRYGVADLVPTGEENFRIRPEDRVTSVGVFWTIPTESDATLKWRQLLADVNHLAGQDALCLSWGKVPYRGRTARWRFRSGTISMRQQFSDSARQQGRWVAVPTELSLQLEVDTAEAEELGTLPRVPCL